MIRKFWVLLVKNHLIKVLPLLAILVVSYFAWRPLLTPGFFSVHDDQQIGRLFEMDKALHDGQFPVRWVPDLGFGLGYPLFNFYPPLTYYLGDIAHLTIQAGFIDSTKVVLLLAFIGSALTMYFLSREFFGRVGGVVSALFYLYAPYHAIDSYVRGAQAELFSFVWLPLILLFSYKTVKDQSLKWSIWTGIVLALLMVTHNLVFLPFFGLFSLWYLAITLIYGWKDFTHFSIQLALSRVEGFLVSSILSFGLTAFFWLPSLAEKQFTLVDDLLIKSLASYKIHFVCWPQLWDSPWGYGGSVAGCVDGLSFKIGKLHVLLALATLAIAIVMFLRKRLPPATFSVLLSTFFLLLFSAFMTTDSSQFIWDKIPLLWYLQFPWRFLEFVALFSSLLAGGVFLFLKNNALKIVCGLILIFGLLYPDAKLFQPKTYLTNATDAQLTSPEEIKWRVSSTSFEYLPKGIATTLTPEGAVWIDITKTYVDDERAIATVLQGDFAFQKSQFFSDHFSLTGESQKGANLQVRITNFPGWAVWLDGQKTAIIDANKYKLLTINIPPGQHTITGRFQNTPIRQIGNLISVLAILITLPLVLYASKRSQS